MSDEGVDGTYAEEGEPSNDPLTEIRKRNEGLVEQLSQNGMGVGGDIYMMVAIDTLVELLIPTGPFRHVYEMQKAINLNGILTEAAGNIARQKLTEGVPGVTA